MHAWLESFAGWALNRRPACSLSESDVVVCFGYLVSAVTDSLTWDLGGTGAHLFGAPRKGGVCMFEAAITDVKFKCTAVREEHNRPGHERIHLFGQICFLLGDEECGLTVLLSTRSTSDHPAPPGWFLVHCLAPFRRILWGCRFSSDILTDAYKYEIDVEQGVVVSHGPAASMEGALPMELPTVSWRGCRTSERNTAQSVVFCTGTQWARHSRAAPTAALYSEYWVNYRGDGGASCIGGTSLHEGVSAPFLFVRSE